VFTIDFQTTAGKTCKNERFSKMENTTPNTNDVTKTELNLNEETTKGMTVQALKNHGEADVIDAWDNAEPAPQFLPLPKDKYKAKVAKAGLHVASTGSRAFQLDLEVIEGPFSKRHVWHNIWITPKAISFAKRDLGKFEMFDYEDLGGVDLTDTVCEVWINQEQDDKGRLVNKVSGFEVLDLAKKYETVAA